MAKAQMAKLRLKQAFWNSGKTPSLLTPIYLIVCNLPFQKYYTALLTQYMYIAPLKPLDMY